MAEYPLIGGGPRLRQEAQAAGPQDAYYGPDGHTRDDQLARQKRWQQTQTPVGESTGGPGWSQDHTNRSLGLGVDDKRQEYLRYLQSQSRGQQQQGAGALWNIAQGNDSTALRAAALQQDAARRMAASQQASMASYDPAAVRGAQMAGSDAVAQIGGQASLAAAQERQAALQNYMNAVGGIRGQDTQQQGLEAQNDAALRNFLLGKETAAQGWTNLGTNDAWNREKGMLDRELKWLEMTHPDNYD